MTHLLVALCSIVIATLGSTAATAQKTDVKRAFEPELLAVWRPLFKRPSVIPVPATNPTTRAKIALGHKLFFDTRLSRNGNRSCATCHQPERAFTDGRKTALGRDGKALLRNTPSIFNLAWGSAFYWDGRATTLEAQARVPIEHPDELGMRLPDLAHRLGSDRKLAADFEAAFGSSSTVITPVRIVQAIAAYERTLISPPTRFDAWIGGNDHALNVREKAGFDLFVGKAGCVACHVGWRFTDNKFHDIGLARDGEAANDPGRGAVTGGTPGLPAFKTPGLRELSLTAPYMHNGSLPTLAAVVDHYAGGLTRRNTLSSNMVPDLSLTKREKGALIAFLRTLSSRP